jgi:hypothetical protein
MAPAKFPRPNKIVPDGQIPAGNWFPIVSKCMEMKAKKAPRKVAPRNRLQMLTFFHRLCRNPAAAQRAALLRFVLQALFQCLDRVDDIVLFGSSA